jgi:hypothetical protein
MMKKKSNKRITTFEREMKDAKFKATFDREYQEFALRNLFQQWPKAIQNLFVPLLKLQAYIQMLSKTLSQEKRPISR